MALSDVEKEIYQLLEVGGSATIVGKSGSGKTWTARKLSDLAVKNGLFDSIIWLYLNRKYDPKSLYMSIAHQLSLFSNPWEVAALYDDTDMVHMDLDILEFEEEDQRKLEKMISDALKRKKFLLVLDDEGKKMTMEEIGHMLPSCLQTCGTFLMTTVNEDGSHNDLGPKTVFKVGSLSKDESMSLLRRKAGSEALSLLRESARSEDFEIPLVKTLAEAFVDRVMDQPAAIIVTAKALSYLCKSTSGVRTLESALKEVLNDEKPNSIKLLCNAHELLPSRILVDHAWRGSHFFRDRGSIHCNEIIAYWILEGYLGRIDSINKAYQEGHRVLMDLIDCQLLKKVDDNCIIMEMSEDADYIVQERTMLRLDNCHRSGFDGIAHLGLAGLFEDGKWGGLGIITQADGMIRTPQKDGTTRTPRKDGMIRTPIRTPRKDGMIRKPRKDGMKRTPQKGQDISMAMLDGNGMCKEVLNNFCQSNPQLQVLAIFNPTLESLPQAFNSSLASHPPPISYPTLTSQLPPISNPTLASNPTLTSQLTPISNPTLPSLPPIVSCMTKLDILVLRGCDFLVDIGHIGELSKLTVLEISGASSLVEMPDDIFEKMTILQSLHLSSIQIKNLPRSFYQLTKLQRLLLKDCPNLVEVGRLENWNSLVVLNLSGATSLKEFRCKSLEPMKKLQTLDLSNTSILNLPKFGKMEQLTRISLRGCSHLRRLPSIASLPGLQVFDISGAKEISEFHDNSLKTNVALDILDLSGTQIRNLPSIIGNPRHLSLKGCSSLEELPFMESLKSLEALDLSDASNLKIEVKFFEFLGKLRFLNLSKTKIESLPYLSNHFELRQLLLSHCSSLHKLPQLKNLTKLEVLDLSGCTHLEKIQAESFDQMTCLQRLVLSETQFEYLPSLSNLFTLRVLLLSNCTKLKELPSLESLSKLEELNLSSVTCLGETGADFLENKGHLQILDLSETNLQKLPSVSRLENLSQLSLRGCKHLEEVPDLQDLTKLEVLDLSGTAISQLPSLNNLTNLHQLQLRDCPNLGLFFCHEMHDLSRAILKQLDTPNVVKNIGGGSKKINCREEEEVVNQYQWHISNLPEMIIDSNRPLTSVSGSTFFKLLEKNLSFGEMSEKSPLVVETGLKQFHLSVHPVDKQNSGGIHCYRDVRGIYFQARCFPHFNEQGISLEICGFHDLPKGIEDVLSCAEYVFLFDNIFIKDLYDLGAKNIKLMKGCWVERCENMHSVFHSDEVGDISELGKNLEILWLSNVLNLTSIYSGNLQREGFRNLKQMYLDCCPRLSHVFSSSQLPENLEILHIKFSDNLEGLFDQKSGQCVLPKVHTLHLWELPKLKSIGCMIPNLDTLIVGECSMLTNVFFPPELPENLTILQIKGCQNLETVVENTTLGNYKLPKLLELNLLGLPKLKSIGAALPSSQYCNRIVRCCPHLPLNFDA